MPRGNTKNLKKLLSASWIKACQAVDHDNGLEDMLNERLSIQDLEEGYFADILRIAEFTDMMGKEGETELIQKVRIAWAEQFAVWHYG